MSIPDSPDATPSTPADPCVLSEEMAGFSIEDIAVPVFLFALDGRILSANTAAARLLGLPHLDLQRTSIGQFAPHWHGEAWSDLWKMAGEVPLSVEGRFRHRDNREIPIKLHGWKRRLRGREILTCTVQDISPRTSAVEALSQQGAELESIIDEMSDVFLRTSWDGEILAASRSLHPLLGWKQQDVLGQKIQDFYADPQDRIHVIEALERQDGQLHGHDLRMRHRDGTVVWISLSCHRTIGLHGQFVIDGVMRDVSGRKQAEVALIQARETVQSLLDASSDATMLFDREERLLACNSILSERLNRPREDLVGRTLAELFPVPVVEGRQEAVHTAFSTKKPFVLRDIRNGRTLENLIIPLQGDTQEIDRVAVFSRDISDQLADQAKLAETIETLRRSNEELEQFAYVASHDLREPLRLVSNYVSLLERRYADKLDDDARVFIGFACDSAKRMNSLILDLLEYSRVSRAVAPLVPLALRAPLDIALKNVSITAAELQANIHVDVPETLTVSGDCGQLSRVFQNLIGNALKYRHKDRRPTIRIRGWQEKQMVRIDISDNGIGIDPEYFGRLFRLFQRLHSHHEYEGTGIGLAVCKRIIDHHGGRIDLDSLPGEGTTFHVTLPLPRA